MQKNTLEDLKELPLHTVYCPSCRLNFPVKVAQFGGSAYSLIGCDRCPNLLALSEVDPVVLYLENKAAGNSKELQNNLSRALIPCSCDGRFCIFDSRRRCPNCKETMQEADIVRQIPNASETQRPILTKLMSPESDGWANLDFLLEEIEAKARAYEKSQPDAQASENHEGWLAKEIFDRYVRKMTLEKLRSLVPNQRKLFSFNNRIYHDHNGARGPWWKFWERDVLYPEKCGIVFDIDQKQLKCASCGETFQARI